MIEENNSVEARIAQLEFDLFVTNTKAAAIQQPDGRYIIKYFPLSPMIIENMLKNCGSLGCYQQVYKSDKIKWICFDFDCKDKEHPQVELLFSSCVKPFVKILDKLEIGYLTEFSGRRGIHVWIMFQSIFSKEIGYNIVLKLKNMFQEIVKIEESTKWGLDLFPATGNSKGNKVGKQVKLPLSCHKKGVRSYFFTDDFQTIIDTTSVNFYLKQKGILQNVSKNSVSDVIKKLALDSDTIGFHELKYTKYDFIGNVSISISEAIAILSKTKVYKNIFDRMYKGTASSLDRTVLLGTFYLLDKTGKFINDLFTQFLDYDEDKTKTNIARLGEQYFPATFGYLYYIYDLEIENNIEPKDTGLVFLLKELHLEDQLIKRYVNINEKQSYLNVSTTIEKEKRYLSDNDEVTNVLVLNDLKNTTNTDVKYFEYLLQSIENKETVEYHPEGYKVYLRKESESKTRKLVTLSADDRIITTHLAIKLCSILKYKWNSYSYQISLLSKEYIFYAWYSSWGLFLANIRTFLEVNYLSDFSVIYLDLKGFYDHIDFLSIYRTIESTLLNNQQKQQLTPIFNFLINYNDELMKSINDGKRIGVPQGPAYARIIAEIFLDQVLKKILKDENNNIHLFRYVDDIVIFCKPNTMPNRIYQLLTEKLPDYGLKINTDKSRIYGKIEELSIEERRALLHYDSFNYDLIENERTGLLFESERLQRIRELLINGEFEIGALGYIFGKNTIPEAPEWYMKKYYKEILSSKIGRGSNFKRFYQYLLQDTNFMFEIMNQESLKLIPIQSINFSNFVHELYMLLKDNKLDRDLLIIIIDKFLLGVVDNIIDEDDKIVAQALINYKTELTHVPY